MVRRCFDQKRPRTELAIKVIPLHIRSAGGSCGVFTELDLGAFCSRRIGPRFGVQLGETLFRVSQLSFHPKGSNAH